MKLEKMLKVAVVVGALVGLPIEGYYMHKHYTKRAQVFDCISNVENSYGAFRLTPERQNQIKEYCEWKCLKKYK